MASMLYRVKESKLWPGLALVLAVVTGLPWQSGMAESAPLVVSNTSKPSGQGDWYWTAYIQGPAGLMNQIQCVVYTLHPTFTDPVRRVCDMNDQKQRDPKPPPDAGFFLDATGWGTFALRAHIEFKDGTSQDLEHMLAFSGRS